MLNTVQAVGVVEVVRAVQAAGVARAVRAAGAARAVQAAGAARAVGAVQVIVVGAAEAAGMEEVCSFKKQTAPAFTAAGAH